MNGNDIIITIKSSNDIENITDNTKYINLCVDCVNNDIVDYFLEHGKKYLYSDSIGDRRGFIYANYDMFKEGELIVNNIITNMPSNLNEIEKLRYIYVSLGKLLYSDINVMREKNETISFSTINNINNIWSALCNRKVNDTIICKILMYVCARIGIKSELINSNIKGNMACKIYIDNSFLIVDLFNDLYNIQGCFITRYFDKYNDNKDIDKKILYIKDEYADYYIDNVLKNNMYGDDDILEKILLNTSNIINVNNIGTYELYKIYRNIFDKYTPNYDVRINNLFVNNGLDIREHFTLFSYNNNYYSYNYNRGTFVNVEYSFIADNIEKNIIGIYDDEDFKLIEKSVLL